METDILITIGEWVEFAPILHKDLLQSKPLRGKVLKVDGAVVTLDIMSSKPHQMTVNIMEIAIISQPLPDEEMPEHLLDETQKRMMLPREKKKTGKTRWRITLRI